MSLDAYKPSGAMLLAVHLWYSFYGIVDFETFIGPYRFCRFHVIEIKTIPRDHYFQMIIS